MGTRTVSPHDEFFKEIFGDLDRARDFLRDTLPPDVRELLDLSRISRFSMELMKTIFTRVEVKALMERLIPDDGPMDQDLGLRFLRVVLRYIFKRSYTDAREALTYTLHPATREVAMTWEEQILTRGRQEGLEQGIRRKALEDAKKLVEHGVSWAIITSATGVVPEDLA